MNAPTFVQRMYAAGAHGYFDALSYHPTVPLHTTPFSQEQTLIHLEQVAAIRSLMVANGDGARQVWATEYGLPTSSVSEATGRIHPRLCRLLAERGRRGPDVHLHHPRHQHRILR